MARLIFAPLAKADLKSIVRTIATDNPTAAKSFNDKVRQTCWLIASHPLIGEAMPEYANGKLRAIPYGNYIIYYQVVQNAVEVVRIVHGAREQDQLF
jgi:toxin ParE1/3/4